MLFHKKHWQSVITSSEPFTSLINCKNCKKCGEWHVERSGFITREDIDRKVDKSLKEKEKVLGGPLHPRIPPRQSWRG